MQRFYVRPSLVSCETAETAQIVTKSVGNNRNEPLVPVWELVERARASGHNSPVVSVVAPLASLLVLRWAAFMEAEQEAIASFNEAAFSPLLPTALRQPSWQRPEDLSARIVDALDGLGTRNNGPYLKYAAAVA